MTPKFSAHDCSSHFCGVYIGLLFVIPEVDVQSELYFLTQTRDGSKGLRPPTLEQIAHLDSGAYQKTPICLSLRHIRML